LEHWQNAASKIKSRTFLNKEYEQIHPLLSQSGWFITIAAVHHVWIRVNDEEKFKYLETQILDYNLFFFLMHRTTYILCKTFLPKVYSCS